MWPAAAFAFTLFCCCFRRLPLPPAPLPDAWAEGNTMLKCSSSSEESLSRSLGGRLCNGALSQGLEAATAASFASSFLWLSSSHCALKAASLASIPSHSCLRSLPPTMTPSLTLAAHVLVLLAGEVCRRDWRQLAALTTSLAYFWFGSVTTTPDRALLCSSVMVPSRKPVCRASAPKSSLKFFSGINKKVFWNCSDTVRVDA